MRLVVIESPYAGRHGHLCNCADCRLDVLQNVEYLRDAMADCFARGEAPFASHGLYTQPGVLNDAVLEERELGINAGLCWGDKADVRVVYMDLGVSKGMQLGMDRAVENAQPVEIRSLPKWAR